MNNGFPLQSEQKIQFLNLSHTTLRQQMIRINPPNVQHCLHDWSTEFCRAANQRIPRAWDVDISQPPPPLFAEPVRADSFGEGGPSSYAPSRGEVYKASLGLTGKNPVQALGELCTRLRLPPPYFTVAVRSY